MFMKGAQIDGAHLQCVNNHYTKFEYKGMQTFGGTDYPKVFLRDGWNGPTTGTAFL